jgi:hypothetical protein
MLKMEDGPTIYLKTQGRVTKCQPLGPAFLGRKRSDLVKIEAKPDPTTPPLMLKSPDQSISAPSLPRAPSKSKGVERDPSPALLRRAPSPLGEGYDVDFSPSPLGRVGTARRGVRGFFAGDAFMAMGGRRRPRL